MFNILKYMLCPHPPARLKLNIGKEVRSCSWERELALCKRTRMLTPGLSGGSMILLLGTHDRKVKHVYVRECAVTSYSEGPRLEAA